MQGNSLQLNRPSPEWLPIELTGKYNETDLTYEFCLRLFGQLEAVKREKFPSETMRQWFIEFVRRGWTKLMLMERYKGLLSTKIYGIEKLDIADWINAVEVFALDEVRLMVNRKIETLITRGRFLKDKEVELTDEDKKAMELAAAKDAEFDFKNRYSEKLNDYREERRKQLSSKYVTPQ